MSVRRYLTGLAVVVMSASCGGIIDPSKNTVENFADTLPVGGTVARTYAWDRNGEIEVTITSLSPSPGAGGIGVAIGQVTGSSCPLLQGYATTTVVNRKVPFGLLNKGSYCLVIFDPGTLTVPVAYAGTFSHP